jgi:streptogramin lyase
MSSLVVTGVLARPVEAATGDITEFAVPAGASSGPQNMAVGADGNIWFTEQSADKIGQILPGSPNTITEFPVPTAASQPNGIAPGPDGNIWFTEFNAGKIGKITPGGTITEYSLPAGATSGPRNITAGPDGAMWFTEYNANNIGRITTSGTITEFPVATKSNPRGIIAGPDGNVWFTEYTADQIGFINPTSDAISLFPVPTASAGPRSIDAGPDGNLWFTENNAAKVARILTASPNTITEFPTPTSGSIPARMTAGPDGNMWFSENGSNKIGQILPGSPNTITEYPIPTANSAPVGIIAGPDHNIWFAENGAGKIGRLSVVLPTTSVLDSNVNPSLSAQSVTLTATVSPASATGTVTFFEGTSSIGTGTLSGGSATLVTSSLAVGSHSITAVYGGDTYNITSTSNAVVQVVQAITGTGLGSSKNPSSFGDSVTFTTTVTPSTATGTVTFLDGVTSLGTGTLSAGVATLATSALNPGMHSITAQYGGDTLDAGGTSSPVSQQVNQLDTTTGVASNNNPTQNGQGVTFTATVLPSTAGGTVTFYDGLTSLGTGLLSSGIATLTTSSLGVGPHSITAAYGGDADDAGSTSTALSQTVNPGNTSTGLGSSENPSAFGDSVTFTATVSPSTATGTVTFFDGITSLGTGTVGSGVATLSTSALSGGSHDITAVYGGDTSDDGSSSAILTQVVNPVGTATILGSGENPSIFGDSVTFTATVTPSSATGTVSFFDGLTSLGTGTLSGGTATLSTTTLSGGAHNITAVYGSDFDDASSPSSVVVQQVNRLATGTVVNSSVNPSQNGQSIIFSATVSPSTATGSVTFFDGSVSLGTGGLTSGSATLSTSALSVSSHSITAVYGGDTDDAGSPSLALTQVVQAITATGIGSSLNPAQFGQSVMLTVTVTPSTVTGTVTFFDGSTSIGSGTLSGGIATLTTSTLAVGSHSTSAVYGGDSGDTSSTSTPLTQVVNQDPSTTVVTSSLNPSQPGQSVTFTATVTPPSATGTVTFKDGANSLATARVTAGVGTLTTTTLSAGSHSITGVYSGDTDDVGSTSVSMTQSVGGNTTTTALTSSVNPSKSGQKVTFTATVTPASATGKVTFKDGSTKLGTATLKNGVATFSTTTLAVGTHEITASYAGNSQHPGSKSSKLAQKVTKKGKVVVAPRHAPLESSSGTVSIDLIGRRLDQWSL